MTLSVTRILERCEAVGIKPNGASLAAGLGADYIRNLERAAIREPSIVKFHALAEVLKTNALYLAGFIDDPRPSPPPKKRRSA